MLQILKYLVIFWFNGILVTMLLCIAMLDDQRGVHKIKCSSGEDVGIHK